MTIPAPLINHATMLVPLGECSVCKSMCIFFRHGALLGRHEFCERTTLRYYVITVETFNT